ncbi:uncharacterized protein LOC134223979 [Armigeres subalbatus]|uniref:uncharacterized protein LOC134223979 n=1 Tax=Armigeres subalbatus TaxID=124917 RepID=UPI002ED531A5
MKFIVILSLIAVHYTRGNCSSVSTIAQSNEVSKHFSPDDYLAFVEKLAKQLEQATLDFTKDTVECFPLIQQNRRMQQSDDVLLRGNFRSKSSESSKSSKSSESSSLESNLWDMLKELVTEAFETIRDVIKRLLGIKKVAHLLRMNNLENVYEQHITDEKVEEAVVHVMKLLQNSDDLDSGAVNRLGYLMHGIKQLFMSVECLLRRMETDHD